MKIRTTPYFDRRYKKLPFNIKKKAVEREKIFLKTIIPSRKTTQKYIFKKK